MFIFAESEKCKECLSCPFCSSPSSEFKSGGSAKCFWNNPVSRDRLVKRWELILFRTSATSWRRSLDSLSRSQIDRVIEMVWEDRTTFEAIEYQFGLKHKDVIALMRLHLKTSSYRTWRRRVSGRKTKHAASSYSNRFRAKCHKWSVNPKSMFGNGFWFSLLMCIDAVTPFLTALILELNFVLECILNFIFRIMFALMVSTVLAKWGDAI